MIRNAIAYRLPEWWPHTASETAELLSRRAFLPCGSLDTSSSGFVPPRDDASLCEAIGSSYVMAFQEEEKILPAAVVAEYAEIKADEIEASNGYRPGRRQMREIREQVTQELLPQAFTKKRRSLAWVSQKHRLLVVEATSESKAEDVLDSMRLALGSLPVELIRTERAPAIALADWLLDFEPEDGFSIDRDCELRAITEDAATVKYSRGELDREEIAEHIMAGHKSPVTLGITFDDRVSFVVTNKMHMKKIRLLDVCTLDFSPTGNAADDFDGSFVIASEEIMRAFAALIAAFGGYMKKPEEDLADQAKRIEERPAA